MKNNREGFTLIELLVVIAIISLLSGVVVASLNSARIKSRNAARLSAVRTLVNAFNLSYSATGVAPNTASVWVCVTATCYEGWSSIPANATVDAFFAPNLPRKPSDPVGGSRGFGGFAYINQALLLGAWGAYLNYLLEPSGSCGPGTVVAANANYTQCMLRLD